MHVSSCNVSRTCDCCRVGNCSLKSLTLPLYNWPSWLWTDVSSLYALQIKAINTKNLKQWKCMSIIDSDGLPRLIYDFFRERFLGSNTNMEKVLSVFYAKLCRWCAKMSKSGVKYAHNVIKDDKWNITVSKNGHTKSATIRYNLIFFQFPCPWTPVVTFWD